MKNVVKIILVVVIVSVFSGCSCKHEYSEATCKQPATCKLCGEETGTVTEHTTDFGKCNICGEKINYDYFESVNEYLIMAAKDAEKAVEAISEYRALMNKDPLGYVGAYEENIKIIFGHFSDAKKNLELAEKACGSYKELANLKKEINEAIKLSPLTNENVLTMKDYMERVQVYGDALEVIGKEMNVVENKFK